MAGGGRSRFSPLFVPRLFQRPYCLVLVPDPEVGAWLGGVTLLHETIVESRPAGLLGSVTQAQVHEPLPHLVAGNAVLLAKLGHAEKFIGHGPPCFSCCRHRQQAPGPSAPGASRRYAACRRW